MVDPDEENNSCFYPSTDEVKEQLGDTDDNQDTETLPLFRINLKCQKLKTQLDEIRNAMIDVKTNRKKLERQARKLEDELEKHNRHARKAIKKGNEELARKALKRKHKKINQVDEIREKAQEKKSQEQDLKDKLDRLRKDIDELEEKKDTKQKKQDSTEATASIC